MSCAWCADRPEKCAACDPRLNRVVPQPLPTPGGQSVFAEARRRINAALDARESKGIATYGRTLETFNGRDAHQDKAEEFIDGFLYETQAALERKKLEEDLFLAREAGGELMGLVRLLLNPSPTTSSITRSADGWLQLAREAEAKHGPKFPLTKVPEKKRWPKCRCGLTCGFAAPEAHDPGCDGKPFKVPG